MLFIAEIGLNHNGNFGLIPELVKQAAGAGANIAKFQLGWRSEPGDINHIDEANLQNMIQICDYYEIELMFSVFTEAAYEMLKPYNPQRYKIASRTVIDNPDLVRTILDEGKETFVSLGMWNENHLPFEGIGDVKYLWCKSQYPTMPWMLENMPKDFQSSFYAGFSDHSVGIDTALLAIARGAKIVERHFTLDKSDTTIRDHALSSTPDEFSLMVRIGKGIYRSLALGV